MKNNSKAQSKEQSDNPHFSEVFDFFCKSDIEITFVQTFYNRLSIRNEFPENWKELAKVWVDDKNQEVK